MVLCEEKECRVCYLRYSRAERVPRELHCHHTFCAPCLEAMAQTKSGMLTVRCPLCRQVTCMRRGLTLQEGLWVDTQLWDQISEEEEEAEDEGGLDRQGERLEEAPVTQAECRAAKPHRRKLKLPLFLRRLSFSRQPQERIVPGCNVEMKSWRRLSAEEML
ncbi:RING finger protein 227 [Denticeps clupeoides]|uniref:RING finger protein 227 n=1 Tax=Denticeps clupeoides TaxID=299321 RepID=UPI0010A33DDC|nr:RING finger protein 227-like [Denticeps clupeoides]